MTVKTNNALGLTTVWVASDEVGTAEYEAEIKRLSEGCGRKNKLVVYISGDKPLGERTGALLRSQLR